MHGHVRLCSRADPSLVPRPGGNSSPSKRHSTFRRRRIAAPGRPCRDTVPKTSGNERQTRDRPIWFDKDERRTLQLQISGSSAVAEDTGIEATLIVRPRWSTKKKTTPRNEIVGSHTIRTDGYIRPIPRGIITK